MLSEKTTGRRIILGDVISNKMDRTVVVQAARLKKHPMYGKYFRTFKKFKAHDEKNECEVGDKVLIVECQPMSKHKRYRLKKIVEKVKKVS